MRSDSFLNTHGIRRRLLKSFSSCVRQYYLICIGFSLWWTWVMFIYQSSAVFPDINCHVSGHAVRVPGCIGPVVVIALTLLVMAALYKRKRFILGGKPYFVTTAIVMMVGALLSEVWVALGVGEEGASMLLYFVLSVVLGIGSAFMYTEFNRALGWLGMLKTLFLSMVSVLAGSFVLIVHGAMPTLLQALFFVLSPYA